VTKSKIQQHVHATTPSLLLLLLLWVMNDSTAASPAGPQLCKAGS
jgi:hypothetical protein